MGMCKHIVFFISRLVSFRVKTSHVQQLFLFPLSALIFKYDLMGYDMAWFPRILKFIYYCTIVSAFCANMIVVSHTTTLSVLGAGMALRGPDGSMMTATDGLYEERRVVFKIFGIGLACTVGSVVCCGWILLHWESALVCMGLTLYTCRTIWRNYIRATSRFRFDENETVDFRDIMEGPAAIQAVPSLFKRNNFDNYDVEYQKNSFHEKEMKRRGKSQSPKKDLFAIQTI